MAEMLGISTEDGIRGAEAGMPPLNLTTVVRDAWPTLEHEDRVALLKIAKKRREAAAAAIAEKAAAEKD